MTIAGNHLLVVDDSQVNRTLLQRSLEQQGHHVLTAENGRRALELLEQEPFDLVLLDIEMPELNGYDVLSAMKADARWRHTPVIMVTAVDELESAIRCIELGAEDYLPKPFNPVVLQARLGASLEKKHLRDKEQLYLKSLERELEIGREIQAGFLPAVIPQAPGWEIAACLQSAREVAGDFYDAFTLEAGGRICLVIADVCDKGVGAALFMTLFRSLLRFTMGAAAAFGGHTPAEWLRHAAELTNNYIATTHGDTGMFATIFLALLDPAASMLDYINAGHETPLLLQANGRLASLKRSGPAVGLFEDADFRVDQVQLGAGDLLFAFTDGVPDALDDSGRAFGREPLTASLHGGCSASELLAELRAQLSAHMGEAEQFDDITMLAVRKLADESLQNFTV